MIKRLALRNWKSHSETTLEFGKGTNILVGVMGSGKSSALEAIAFALFGTFPNAHRKRVKITDVITGRPEEKDFAEVDLAFEWDGEEYSVKRRVGRKGASEAELRRGGALVACETEKVTAEIERLLKMDYGVFYRAVYAEQNRMDYLLALDPGERKRQVDELLGIDRFERARANAGTAIGYLRRMKEEKEKGIAGVDFAGLEARVNESREAGARAESELAAAQKALTAAKDGLFKAEGFFSSLEREKKEWEALQEKRAGLEHGVKLLSEEAAKRRGALGAGFGGAESVSREIAEAEKAEALLKAEFKSASSRLSSLKEREGVLRLHAAELGEASKRKAEFARKALEVEGGSKGAGERLSEARKKHGEALSLYSEARAREKEIASSIESLMKAGCDCPVCERPIGEELRAKLREGKAAEASAAKARASEFPGKISSLEKNISVLEKALRDAELSGKMATELGDVSERLEAAGSELASVKAEIGPASEALRLAESGIEAQAAKAGKLRELLSAARELSSVEGRLASSINGLAEVRERVSLKGFDAEAFERARRIIGEARGKAIAAEGEARLCLEKAKSAKERLMLQEKDLHAFTASREEAGKLGNALEDATVLQSCLVETQAALRVELIGAVNEAMAALWGGIYPYRDYSSARLRAGDADYVVEVRAGDAWLPVDGFASGGERACALIALRIAFAMVVVPNLRWLVLDEPTHNLDENGIKSLVAVLRERIPEIVEQVFVITHDENLREAASARIYRIERDKEALGPSRAVEL